MQNSNEGLDMWAIGQKLGLTRPDLDALDDQSEVGNFEHIKALLSRALTLVYKGQETRGRSRAISCISDALTYIDEMKEDERDYKS